MPDLKERACAILQEFKKERYAFGGGVLDDAPGRFAAELGKRALLVGPVSSGWFSPVRERVLASLKKAGVEVAEEVHSAGPNAPFVDVYRIHSHIMHKHPDVVVVADGGSGIDAVKASAVLATLGDLQSEIDPFFGVGQVTAACQRSGRSVLPVVAVMMASSSGAHLTKYANITDPVAGQKKLIVDEAIVPPRAVFDYDVTATQPMSLTLDGGLDGIAHCLEVYFGAASGTRAKAREVAELGIELIIKGLTEVTKDAHDREARTLLRSGRLRHHDRRHVGGPPVQFLPGGRLKPRPGVRPDEPVLHRLLRAGGPRAAAGGRPDLREVRLPGGGPGLAVRQGTGAGGGPGDGQASIFPRACATCRGSPGSISTAVLPPRRTRSWT